MPSYAMVKKSKKPMRVQDYPKLIIRLKPELRARVEAASTMLHLPANTMVTEAIEEYLKQLKPSVKRDVNALGKKLEDRYL